MAYNQNIPQPADQLKNSQPQLLANFQEINTLIDVNHVGFNLADSGKHKFLQMPRQGGAPTTAATDLGLFAFLGANSGVSELNLRRQADGAVIPFTEGLLATPGWTILPCGLVVKWGTIALPAQLYQSSQSQAVVYPVAGNIRAFTQPALFTFFSDSFTGNTRLSPFVYSINTSGVNSNTQFSIRISSVDKQNVVTGVVITVNWLAVGI